MFSAPLHKSNTKEKPEEKKSTGSSKTFVICIVAVALLGVAIAVAMCVFQPGRR